MVNDKFDLCKRSATFKLYLRKKSTHIKDKRELNAKIYLVANEYWRTMNFIVNDRSRANCKEVVILIVIESINSKLTFAIGFYHQKNFDF